MSLPIPDLAALGFAAPWLLVLLPAPALLRRVLPRIADDAGGLRVPASFAAITDARGGAASPAARGVLAWVCWAALLVAASGPQADLRMPALAASGRDIMLVLDLSGSMERTDFTLDGAPARRVDVVRRIADDFVRRRAGDRIGLVLFAEQAYLAAPLSFDLAGVRQALAEATIGLAGRSTAIGDGLGLAVKRLRAAPGPTRLAVLLSDGANNAGTVAPLDAARLARDVGVRVDTIAFGTTATDDADPQSDLDPAALAEIARLSGGAAFRVRSTDELAAVYRRIDALEGAAGTAPPAILRRPLWPWPAAVALAAALLLLAPVPGAAGRWRRR